MTVEPLTVENLFTFCCLHNTTSPTLICLFFVCRALSAYVFIWLFDLWSFSVAISCLLIGVEVVLSCGDLVPIDLLNGSSVGATLVFYGGLLDN